MLFGSQFVQAGLNGKMILQWIL